MRATNLQGQRFGRLVVICLHSKKWDKLIWLCLCDCGGEATVNTSELKNGHTKSCGCYRRENTAKMFFKHGGCAKKDKEFSIWCGMIRRCLYDDKTRNTYKYYRGRGITVCQRWIDSYQNFIDDMGPMPSPKHTLDRKDPNGNYEPGNCRWATHIEQANNKRETVRITVNGESKSISEWARHFGMKPNTVYTRYKRGVSVDKLFKPTQI